MGQCYFHVSGGYCSSVAAIKDAIETEKTKAMIDLACGGDPLPPLPEGMSRRSDMRKFKKGSSLKQNEQHD